MKLQTTLLASFVFAQTAFAQTQTSAPIPLPAGAKVSPTASRAAEAPTWTGGPPAAQPAIAPNTAAAVSPQNQPAVITSSPAANAFGAAPATAIQTLPGTAAAGSTSPSIQFNPTPESSIVVGSETQSPGPVASAAATATPQMLPPSDDAKALAPPPTTSDPAADNRPLQSVMIRSTTIAQPAAVGTQVAPARFDAPLTASPIPAAVPAVAPTSGVVPASTVTPATIAPHATVPQPKAPVIEPVDAEKAAAARAAADLLAGSLTPEKGAVMVGLSDAIKTASDPARVSVVRAYWQLSRAWSDYHWSVDEQKRLENVVPSRSAVDSPMLSTARAAATARVADAQIAVSAAAETLARAAGLPWSGQTNFPTDAPLVGVYRTYYEALFVGRVSPGRTREIDRSLPIRLKSINDLTASVQSATSAVHYAEEAHAKGEADMRTVLACHETLHNQRRAFLDAVAAYNNDIAEYAATVAAPGTPGDKFVGMLITVKQVQRPPLPATSAAAVAQPARPSDGWVPSTARPTEAPTAAQQPPAASAAGPLAPAGPLGQQPDPFRQ